MVGFRTTPALQAAAGTEVADGMAGAEVADVMAAAMVVMDGSAHGSCT